MIVNKKTQLYHCTKSKALIEILKSKCFMYSYCLENFYVHKINKFTLEKRAYAMVCFADMLPGEVSRHMRQFKANSYLIMDKRWAKDRGISPVEYYDRDSLTNKAFLGINKYTEAISNCQSCDADIKIILEKLQKSIELIRPFFKPYEGRYYVRRTDKESKNSVEFYLEREWRSFPVVEKGEHAYLSLEDYKNKDTFDKEKKRLTENNSLKFEWNDVILIGCTRNKKNEVIDTIIRSFGVALKEAKKKVRLID